MNDIVTISAPSWVFHGLACLWVIAMALNTYATYLRRKIKELESPMTTKTDIELAQEFTVGGLEFDDAGLDAYTEAVRADEREKHTQELLGGSVEADDIQVIAHVQNAHYKVKSRYHLPDGTELCTAEALATRVAQKDAENAANMATCQGIITGLTAEIERLKADAEFAGVQKMNDQSAFEHMREQRDALQSRVKELEQDAGRSLGALNEINNWLVCACIATAEDMAQSFPHMQQVAQAAIDAARNQGGAQ